MLVQRLLPQRGPASAGLGWLETCCLLLALAVLLLLAPAAKAQNRVTEAELKVAYVYNFLRFTEWPQGQPSGRALILCVSATSTLLEALKTLDGKLVNGETITVASFTGKEPTAINCRALLQDGSPPQLVAAAKRGVLSIGNGGALGRNGAVITLVVEGDQLGFDVDTRAAAATGVELSSQLLRLARIVR